MLSLGILMRSAPPPALEYRSVPEQVKLNVQVGTIPGCMDVFRKAAPGENVQYFLVDLKLRL